MNNTIFIFSKIEIQPTIQTNKIYCSYKKNLLLLMGKKSNYWNKKVRKIKKKKFY